MKMDEQRISALQENKAVALEARLKHCRNVITLGVRPNFSDYSEQESELIRNAEKIYYPSTLYADMFDAMGKQTFPSVHTYRFVQDKIKQTTLFQMINAPVPETRFFYGRNRADKIIKYFDFPFIGKIPRGSALGRGVYLIKNSNDLDCYCRASNVAYIQRYLPVDRDIRVVVIGGQAVHAYWRIAGKNEFRSNIEQGGRIKLGGVPQEAVSLAVETARKCGWNDVGIDLCLFNNRLYILEANMKYGRQGFHKAGINYTEMMEGLIRDGKI